jgi:aldehyde dehydrogenase (NAD+)
VISSSTESAVGRVTTAGPADVDRAVAAARNAFDHGPWPRMSAADRGDAIARLVTSIASRASDIADAISHEVGASRKWAKHGQVTIGTAVLGLYAKLASTYEFSSERVGLMGNPITVNRVPAGVVAAIVPWNAPLFIAALKLGPALAAGCTVVLKPAIEAGLDASLLADAIEEAAFPPGVINVILADAAASEHLVRHQGVDKVSFTGSTNVGRRIGELCGADAPLHA